MSLHPSSSMSYFLLANSLGTFVEPWLIGRFGLRRVVLIASALNAVGSFLRSGILPEYRTTSWTVVLFGTIFIGLAQGILQCPISEFTCSWFPPEEQTFVTALMMVIFGLK